MGEGKMITYRDLSGGLKAFVVLGWIIIVLDLLLFVSGFIQGWMSVAP